MKFHQLDLNVVKCMYLDGKTLECIAKQQGCSPILIRKGLATFGIKGISHADRRIALYKKAKQLVDDKASGISVAELSRREGVCKERIYQQISLFVPRVRLYENWPTDKVARLKRLWPTDMGTEDIGKALDMTKNAVIGKARRLGLGLKDRRNKKGSLIDADRFTDKDRHAGSRRAADRAGRQVHG